jgi:hypothetical protein
MLRCASLALAASAAAARAAPVAVFNDSAGGLGLTVFDDDSYAVWTQSAAAPWLVSAFTAGARVGGQLFTHPGVPGAEAATRLGAGAAAGSHPRLGPWRGWQVNITTPAGGPIVNTFQLFAAPAPAPGAEWRGASPLLVFEPSFPLGLQGVNGSSAGDAPDGFAKSPRTATAFPAFMDGNSSTSRTTDFFTWADTFISGATGSHGPVSAGLAAVRGSEGGPLALSSYAQDDTIVLAPFTNLKSTFLGVPAAPSPQALGPVAACGVSDFVAALPPGHSAACAIGYAPGGFNAGMHAWGATMMAAYGTARMDDPSATQLTYWTDNGAYYDFYAYEPNINSKGLVEDILVALADTFKNGTYPGPPIPVKMFMLDAYWMPNTRANANCKMNDTAWDLPFPSGLKALSARLGTPLILYNGPQCDNTTYGAAWPLVMGLPYNAGWAQGRLSQVAAGSSRAFYAQLFAGLQAVGMATFTQDFLDFHNWNFVAWATNETGNFEWLRGQADAALAAGVPVQYCMALPSDILASVAFGAVTNARASQDYYAGSTTSADIAKQSLLLSALGLRASKDNFQTSRARLDRGWEQSPHFQAAAALLGGGPVGFSDALFFADAAVLWPTTTLNGTLLQASRPATTADHIGWGNAGTVRSAHCELGAGGARGYVVLQDAEFNPLLWCNATSGCSVPAQLSASDLFPPPPAAAPFLVWQYNNSACAAQGAPARACAFALPQAAAYAPPPGLAFAPLPPDRTPWAAYTVAPVLPNNYTLLGELGKLVALSPARVRAP